MQSQLNLSPSEAQTTQEVVPPVSPDGDFSLTRQCAVCGEIKPLDSFYRNKNCRLGRMHRCKACQNAITAEWARNNKERHASYIKMRYRRLHPKKKPPTEAEKEARKAKAREKRRAYKKANRDKINAARKKRLAIRKEEDPDRWRERQRNRDRKRMANPRNRAVRNLRRRIRGALNGQYCSEHTVELLGCSSEEFRDHLEAGFTDGMTWDNYGEWHIDHIVPCAKFDLTQESHRRRCFHWSNMQPLWAHDNLSKKADTDGQMMLV